MNKFSDELLVEKLKSTLYAENDEAMNFLYQAMYRKVVYYVQKNNGGEQDAADVFQDALIVLYKLAKADRLDGISNVKAYFFSICRNLWLKALKKGQRTTELTQEHYTLPEEVLPIQSIFLNEKKELLNQLLLSIGESCQKILIHYYYERLKMKEIMKLMNFSSEQVAKNKKSACMKKLREVVLANPDLEELLK